MAKLRIYVDTPEQFAALKGIEEDARTIESLAGSPNWVNERRWRIEILARSIQTHLEAFVKEES